MLKLFLWLRYLRKKKIVFLSIAAVALSVALLIVVDSLFDGYIEALKNSLAANAGDIYLWPGKATPHYDAFPERLEELDGVEAAAPCNFGDGLLYLESGDVREVGIRGLEPVRESKFADWKGSLLRQKTTTSDIDFEVPGHADDDGVWLGINIVAEPNELTDEYDLEQAQRLIGKRVVLTTANHNRKRKVIKFRISDIASTRTYFGDQTLYLPLKKLNKIIYGSNEAEHRWATKVKLKRGIDGGLMKAMIGKVWEEFALQELEWDPEIIAKVRIELVEDLNSDYFAELRKQMGVLLLIFGVTCSAVVLLIFCIFYMIVMTKERDIAIIKSCGASSWSVVSIFIGFGACVGVIGCAFGIIFGYIVTKNINTLEEWVRVVFGLKLWRASSYMLNTIPNEVNWPDVRPIVLAAVVGCCLGALIPAIVAARTKPVEILRYE